MIEVVIYQDGKEVKREKGYAAMWQLLGEKLEYNGGLVGDCTFGELALMSCAMGKHIYEEAMNAE